MSPHCAETSNLRQETLSFLVDHRSLIDSLNGLLFAGNRLPEVGCGGDDPVGVGTVSVWTNLVEDLGNLDAEDVFVLPDRLLAVDQVQNLPAEVMAKHVHAQSRLHLVELEAIRVVLSDDLVQEPVARLRLVCRGERSLKRFTVLRDHPVRIAGEETQSSLRMPPGLPTASVVRSSQATPARRRGQPARSIDFAMRIASDLASTTDNLHL